jgi:prephenate dehydrogenase
MILRKITFRVEKLTIIGVGLIGGSFGRAIRDASAATEVIGYGRNSANLARAVELGLVDRWSTVLSDAVAGAEVVMMATPVSAMPGLFQQLAKSVSPTCIITDAGSAKKEVVDAALASFGESGVRFVPGHPIAGLEKSGVEAAVGNLFKGQKVILTPTPDTDPAALQKVIGLWEATGAELMNMPPERHDRLLALTSHLPHMLAYALVNLLADEEQEDSKCFELAAGGFYDISRIASSDPTMWRDICLQNSDELLARIGDYQEHMARLAALVRSKDAEGLERLFRRAQSARSRIQNPRKDGTPQG